MAIQVADETGTPISAANPLPVEVVGAITLPAAVEVANDVGNPIPVSGTVTANTGLSQPLTDVQLRDTPVPVSGTVTANTGLAQPLTDAQLRAAPVPVSGTVTANTGLTQPLTDAQLRASAVPVSGPLTDAQLRASAVPVTGGLTDAQLRASAVPVSAAALPLPSGAATEATLAAQSALFGAVTEAAPASDTASSGLNGRLQRIAQRITSLIALLPASIGQKNKAGSLSVTWASDSDPLPAGESHIGQIGASTGVVSQTPVVSSSPAYSVGDAVGGLMTFASLARANDKSGYVQQVAVACKSAQAASLDLFLFNANPSGSTITDNAAFDLAAADFDKVIGVVHITDWTACGATRSFAQANNLAIPFKPAAGTATLYACLVARTALTLASTSDLTVTLRAPQD